MKVKGLGSHLIHTQNSFLSTQFSLLNFLNNFNHFVSQQNQVKTCLLWYESFKG